MGDDNKVALKEINLVDVEWIKLAQNRSKYHGFRKTLMKFFVPQNVGNFWTQYGTVSFSKRILLRIVICSLVLLILTCDRRSW